MDIKQQSFEWKFLPDRGITEKSYEHYGVRTKVLDGGGRFCRVYPYVNGSEKTRFLRAKDFRTSGPIAGAGVFGKDKFPAGSAKAITITEGEEDAISVFQMLGSKYPAVSVQSSSSALRDCTTDREYLNSFEKIYLCFDSDAPGQEAQKKVADLFDPLKIHYVKMDRKDANEYLQNGEAVGFSKLWWAAKSYRPEGIISTYDEVFSIFDQELTRESLELPSFLPRLQEMTSGLRRGESWLWTAREGTGKTEILRAIEKQIIDQDKSVGIIHMEESRDRLYRGLVGLHLRRPAHLTTEQMSSEELKAAYTSLTKGRAENCIVYTHPDTANPDELLDAVRYLVVGCGCWAVCYDHIGFSVTGSQTDDQTKQLDYISTRLAMMVKKLDFHLSFVSHVNDNLETRGSRNISKIADVWVHLERPIEHEVDIVRNTTTLTVRKNRPTSYSGPAGQILFDPKSYSYRVKELRDELPVE